MMATKIGCILVCISTMVDTHTLLRTDRRAVITDAAADRDRLLLVAETSTVRTTTHTEMRGVTTGATSRVNMDMAEVTRPRAVLEDHPAIVEALVAVIDRLDVEAEKNRKQSRLKADSWDSSSAETARTLGGSRERQDVACSFSTLTEDQCVSVRFKVRALAATK
jgi:hypothetical protein